MKKLVGVAAAAAAVLCSTTAFAEPESARGTMVQALESVGKASAKNPGNRGLTNATIRLRENARRHDEHQTGKVAAVEERAQLSDRVEGVDRPDRLDRPDTLGRPDRPGRPNR